MNQSQIRLSYWNCKYDLEIRILGVSFGAIKKLGRFFAGSGQEMTASEYVFHA